jgi:hypothetical protein
MRSCRWSTSACRASCCGTNWRRRSGSLGERKAVGLEVVTRLRPGVHRLLRSNYAGPHLTDVVEEALLFRSGETKLYAEAKAGRLRLRKSGAGALSARRRSSLSLLAFNDQQAGSSHRHDSVGLQFEADWDDSGMGLTPVEFQQMVLPNNSWRRECPFAVVSKLSGTLHFE